MKANLEWIDRKWAQFYFTQNYNIQGIFNRKDRLALENMAKLFAAFCLDELRKETEHEIA